MNTNEEALFDSAEHLPPLPKSIQNLQNYLNAKGSDIDINEISLILGADPLITANLLHLANSPFYGFKSEIKTLNQAIILLGINNVKTMIMADYTRNGFKIDVRAYGINTDEFLKLCDEQLHFITTWLLDEDRKLCHNLIPIVMLLRFGMLVFSNYFIQNNLDKRFLLELKKNDFNNVLELEDKFLGVNHLSFLIDLFKHWEFDKSFIEIISHLKNPDAISQELKKECYALAVVECIFSPNIRNDNEVIANKAYSLIKRAKTQGVDFNIENFLSNLPESLKEYV